MIYNDTFTLSNGVKIPALGLGTWLMNDEDMEALKNAPHIKDYGAHSFFPVFGGKL